MLGTANIEIITTVPIYTINRSDYNYKYYILLFFREYFIRFHVSPLTLPFNGILPLNGLQYLKPVKSECGL